MPEWIAQEHEDNFPLLTKDAYEKTSDDDEDYNCIAWAVGDSQQWWEPPVDGVLDPGQYWPKGAPEDIRISSLIRAYELHGFERYKKESSIGFETVALYATRDGDAAHAARLLNDGAWTSKLGCWEDIRHDYLTGLEGDYPAYGYVRCLMTRPNPK